MSVIINKTAKKRYIGQTNNLSRRIAEHNGQDTNPHRYTAKFAGTWELMHFEEYQSRSEAMNREKWLKSGVGRKWLDDNIGKASPPEAD